MAVPSIESVSLVMSTFTLDMHGSIFIRTGGVMLCWICTVIQCHAMVVCSYVGYIYIQFENSSKLPLKDPYQFEATIHHCNFSRILSLQ